ncbi:hypothetical protein [Dyella sp. C9]|uniref:hypothetical protein n=1 Tax=Dyella sp. C9 TaxID=2202154 RepID=UPI0013009C49|nr:hypothetical protein [Dyella sp. C9]
MKAFYALSMMLPIALLLTGCGPSGPTDDDVLNAWKERTALWKKIGQDTLPLPPQAMVDGCKRDPNPPIDKGVYFMCYIQLNGKDDPNRNPIRLQRNPDGKWSAW